MVKYKNVDYLIMTCGLTRNKNILIDIFIEKRDIERKRMATDFPLL
jgi:hypothetical protein